MPDKKDEETPEAGARRIDMRALEIGVRKALAIEPREREGKEKSKKEGRAARTLGDGNAKSQ